MSVFLDTDTPAFAALVNHARRLCTADEWDAMSNTERDLLASGAANVWGTEPVRCDDARVRTVVVRAVYEHLLRPEIHVCLGPTYCNDCFCTCCSRELVDGSCPDRDCEANYRRPTSLNRFGSRNR